MHLTEPSTVRISEPGNHTFKVFRDGPTDRVNSIKYITVAGEDTEGTINWSEICKYNQYSLMQREATTRLFKGNCSLMLAKLKNPSAFAFCRMTSPSPTRLWPSCCMTLLVRMEQFRSRACPNIKPVFYDIRWRVCLLCTQCYRDHCRQR
jgi:hypothetical protein